MCLTYQYSKIRAQSKKAIHRFSKTANFRMIRNAESMLQLQSTGQSKRIGNTNEVIRPRDQSGYYSNRLGATPLVSLFLGAPKILFSGVYVLFHLNDVRSLRADEMDMLVVNTGRLRPENFFRLHVYEMVGFSLLEVYERVGKSVITV